MSTFTKYEAMGFFGILVGIGSLAWSTYQNRKANKQLSDTSKKLDLSISDVAGKTPVEVQKSLVDKAIDIAVNRAVTSAASEAVSGIKRDMNSEIEKQVRGEVNKISSEIKEKVSEEAKNQLDNIDKDVIVREATKKIANELVPEGRKELRHRLDGIVGDLSTDLAGYKKVYDGVKQALSYGNDNNSGKEVSFRIN